MLRVLAEPANLVESTNTDTFSTDRWWIGSNPFHDDRVYEQQPLAGWFAGDHVEELAAFCQRTVDELVRDARDASRCSPTRSTSPRSTCGRTTFRV